MQLWLCITKYKNNPPGGIKNEKEKVQVVFILFYFSERIFGQYG
ncbi:MAG: hypothetical protein Kow00103_14580 [Candidatus Caldatribacteriota bacterium]